MSTATPVISKGSGLVIVGREQRLTCLVTSSETAALSWSRGGAVLQPEREESSAVNGGGTKYSTYYKFVVAASDNLAVFTCTARYPSEEASVTLTVYVYRESLSVGVWVCGVVCVCVWV